MAFHFRPGELVTGRDRAEGQGHGVLEAGKVFVK